MFAEIIWFPKQGSTTAREVDRLRDERLNDLLQARAEPRRRVDEAFIGTIYQSSSPYHQPSGGLAGTVESLDPERLAAAWRRGFDPTRMTLVLAGDVLGAGGRGPLEMTESLLGSWTPAAGAAALGGPVSSESAVDSLLIKVLDRPGSVQTEIRAGHVGVPRRIDNYAALSVMGAILGAWPKKQIA